MCACPQVKQRARQRQAGRDSSSAGSPSVVVVGAGVSGCACAAVLAHEGVRVMVLNSVLDAVGLPGYGPDLLAGSGGWAEIGEAMAGLPAALREAWLNAASVPDNGAPLLVVDRRAVSIETKRALECVPGLQFRQGLVSDVRVVTAESSWSGDPGQGRVAVETVFGEVIEADAVVLAVGLGLGGRVTVGADLLPGGRYGEVPADDLREALEVMGANFREVAMEVGGRFSTHNSAQPGVLADLLSGCITRATIPVRHILAGSTDSSAKGRDSDLEQVRQALRSEPTVEQGDDCGGKGAGLGGAWPDGYPPAVHWTEGLRIEESVLDEASGGVAIPILSPDGMATGELHLSPEGARIAGFEIDGPGGASIDMGAPASRLGHMVHALVVASLTADGRLTLDSSQTPWIWVAGRAAGAVDYLESLRSGARVAHEVVRALASCRSECPSRGFGAAYSHAGSPDDCASGSGGCGRPAVDGEIG